MSDEELINFILKASKSELMELLQEASASKLHELENAICRIIKLID